LKVAPPFDGQRPPLQLSLRDYSAQPDFGALAGGLHFERAAALDYQETRALQHFIDLVIVVSRIVVKQK
jgi:hypothetical protein